MHNLRATAVLVISLGAVLGAAGCGKKDSYTKPATTSYGETSKKDITPEVAALATVVAIDEHEARLGTDAQSETVSASVRDYARTIQTEHGRHAEDTKALARNLGLTLSDPPSVVKLREKGAKSGAKLIELDGDKFEKEFLEAMVDGHEDAIKTIDGFLDDDDVKSEAVRIHLRSTKATVQHHLDMAKGLQSSAK